MNPISAFFVRNIIVVFFVYGLAFFVLGLALALAYRQTSEFKFALAIPFLAAFGISHGIHEWFEMFQQIAFLTSGHVPVIPEELVRLALLALSFLLLARDYGSAERAFSFYKTVETEGGGGGWNQLDKLIG